MSATGVPRKKGRTTTVAEQAAQNTAQHPVHTRALIVGTGFSGLGMGVALQRQGVDFLILEKADDVGGTWRDNSYPGCACDVPSYLYSFVLFRTQAGLDRDGSTGSGAVAPTRKHNLLRSRRLSHPRGSVVAYVMADEMGGL